MPYNLNNLFDKKNNNNNIANIAKVSKSHNINTFIKLERDRIGHGYILIENNNSGWMPTVN